MSILIACPSCGARLKVADNAAGKTVQCPKCGTSMLVPSPSPSSSPGDFEAIDRRQEESPPDEEDFTRPPRRSPERKRRDAQMIISKIGILSAGKFLGTLYALIGLIVGGLFTLLALIGAGIGMANQQGGGGIGALVFGFGAIICAPIFYGVAGFIGGILMALLYNLVAALVGGIEIEVE